MYTDEYEKRGPEWCDRCGADREDECTCDDEPDPELECTRCGGEGRQEGNSLEEPVDEWGEVRCKACGGSGLRKDQTIW